MSPNPDELVAVCASLIPTNNIHLCLTPCTGRIARFGGQQRFMGRERPILTDSGGFQVFSLGHLRSVTDDGVTFRSHIDGSPHVFTPERVIALQEAIGADIIMSLDECLPYGVDEASAAVSLERTHRWAERCRAAQARRDQALFGIVQGGMHARLRRASATWLAGLDLPGYAIGRPSNSESPDEMHSPPEEGPAPPPA